MQLKLNQPTVEPNLYCVIHIKNMNLSFSQISRTLDDQHIFALIGSGSIYDSNVLLLKSYGSLART